MLKINNYLDAENKSKIVNFEGEGWLWWHQCERWLNGMYGYVFF